MLTTSTEPLVGQATIMIHNLNPQILSPSERMFWPLLELIHKLVTFYCSLKISSWYKYWLQAGVRIHCFLFLPFVGFNTNLCSFKIVDNDISIFNCILFLSHLNEALKIIIHSISLCVCVYIVCIYICMYVWIYLHVYTHMYVYIHAYIHTCIHNGNSQGAHIFESFLVCFLEMRFQQTCPSVLSVHLSPQALSLATLEYYFSKFTGLLVVFLVW